MNEYEENALHYFLKTKARYDCPIAKDIHIIQRKAANHHNLEAGMRQSLAFLLEKFL